MMRFDPEYVRSWYDEYGDRESQRWSESPAARMQYEIYVRHLRQRVSPGDRLLDCGCGPGTYARIAMEVGARVTCLDLSPVQLAACRESAPGADDYVLGTVTDLSRFADASFDICLALGGPLSYCFDQVGRAIRELSRVTRPPGRRARCVRHESAWGASSPPPWRVGRAVGDEPPDSCIWRSAA